MVLPNINFLYTDFQSAASVKPESYHTIQSWIEHLISSGDINNPLANAHALPTMYYDIFDFSIDTTIFISCNSDIEIAFVSILDIIKNNWRPQSFEDHPSKIATMFANLLSIAERKSVSEIQEFRLILKDNVFHSVRDLLDIESMPIFQNNAQGIWEFIFFCLDENIPMSKDNLARFFDKILLLDYTGVSTSYTHPMSPVNFDFLISKKVMELKKAKVHYLSYFDIFSGRSEEFNSLCKANVNPDILRQYNQKNISLIEDIAQYTTSEGKVALSNILNYAKTRLLL
jgi:hypothetical protein